MDSTLKQIVESVANAVASYSVNYADYPTDVTQAQMNVMRDVQNMMVAAIVSNATVTAPTSAGTPSPSPSPSPASSAPTGTPD